MSATHPDWDELFVRDARKPVAWSISSRQLLRIAQETWGMSRNAWDKQVEWALEFIREHEVPAGPFQLSEEEARLALDAQLHGIAFMLAGFALENLAKGVLISRNPALVEDSGRLSDSLNTHDLQALVSECLDDLSSRENLVLEEVGTYTRWGGRYPVPLKWEQLRDRKMRARKRGRTTGHDKEGDWKVLGEIYSRLAKLGQ